VHGEAEVSDFHAGTRTPVDEQPFRAVFENALDGVLIADDERRYVEVNGAAAELFGFSREELTGRRIDEFLDPATLSVLERGWRRFLEQGGCKGEHDLIRHDGTIRTVEYSAKPNILPGRHLCVVRDVTDRRRVQEALRESEERLRLALDGARVCAWDWDMASDQISWWGSVDQLVGLGEAPPSVGACLELVDVKDRARVNAAIAHAVEHAAPLDAEFRIRRAEGPTHWVLAKGHVVHDAGGAPVRVLGVALGIDRHKRAEEEQAGLLTKEHAARAAAEAAERRSAFLARASALLAGSLDYRKTLERIANLAVPDIADWCVIDMIEGDGSPCRLAVTHTDPAKAALALEIERRYPADVDAAYGPRGVVRSGRAEVVEDIPDRALQAIARDGEHLDMLRRLGLKSLMCVPVEVRGKRCGAITFVSAESGRRYGVADLALAQDLSARASLAIDNAQLFRDAQEANRIKDEFLAIVSHELRGPLQAMLMWVHVLRGQSVDAATRLRALAGIQQGASMQAALINDLLDVSRIVAGKLTLDVRPLDPAAIVESVVEAIRPAAAAKGVGLEVEVDPGTGRVPADPGRLQQIVWNLLSNAVKFTPEAGRVVIRLRPTGRHAEIVVSDTGQGIAAEFLPHVFEPFRQGTVTDRTQGGLGLGLAIVRQLVDRHGGSVEAASPGAGEGATFTVRIPLEQDPGRDRTARRPADEPPELAGVRVLLVDDDAPEREALTFILQRYHAVVTAVASAAEAMDALDRSPLDVLVSDIVMPGEDGYVLIRKIRARGPQHGGGIPAAAITGHAGEANRHLALLAGFQVHLPKPVSPAELAEIVRSLTASPHIAPS
jgi:PAS domain S-box-containing protein